MTQLFKGHCSTISKIYFEKHSVFISGLSGQFDMCGWEYMFKEEVLFFINNFCIITLTCSVLLDIVLIKELHQRTRKVTVGASFRVCTCSGFCVHRIINALRLWRATFTWQGNVNLSNNFLMKSHLSGYFCPFPRNFGKVAGTYEWYFVNLWVQFRQLVHSWVVEILNP